MYEHNEVRRHSSRGRHARGIVGMTGIAALLAVPFVAGPATAAPDLLDPAELNVTTVGYTADEPAERDDAALPRHADQRTVVDVTAFGADPTGAEDSAAAIRDAFAHARGIDGPVTISFPCGQYRIYPEATEKRELYVSNTVGTDASVREKSIAMLIEGMDDVIVEGNGSQLTFHGKQSQFAVIGSTDVTIRDLGTDWYAPGTLDLTVVDTGVEDGHGYRDIRVPAGVDYTLNGATATFTGEKSPVTGEPYWAFNAADAEPWQNQIRDLATGDTWRTNNAGLPIWHGSRDVRELSPGLLRVSYASATEPEDVAHVYEMRHLQRDTPAGLIWQSERTSVEDIALHYLHGFGIVGQFSTDISIDRARMVTDPGTWRSTAGFADFIQMSGVAGTVQVTNSLFDDPHDDPINIHGTYVQVTGLDRAARQVTLRYMHSETAGFPQFYPGDELRFVSKSTLLPVAGGTATVTAVDGPSGRDHSHDLRTMTITLDGDIPAGVAVGDTVAENLTYNPDVTIAGNTFRSVPTRGILVTTPGEVVIERNHFDQMNMASIYISDDANNWYESSAVEDVTIRNNIFDRPTSAYATIFVEPMNGTTVPGRTVHSGIDIEANRFALRSGGRLIDAKSVSDLTFVGNLVQHWAPTEPVAQASSAALFTLRGSERVEISGNTYADGFNVRANISGMDPSQITGGEVAIGEDAMTGDPAARAVFADDVAVVREDPGSWRALDVDTLSVRAGALGLWQEQDAATNIVLSDTSAPEAVTVKVSGATAGGWEEAGLVFYAGDGDYVTVQRKHDGGSPKLAVVTEQGGVASETDRIPDPGAQDLWLRLTRTGDTFTGAYSLDGATFTDIRTVSNPAAATGRAGILTAGVSPAQTWFTYTDWTVDGSARPFFSQVPDVVEAQPAAALADVDWSGIGFEEGASPLTWFGRTGPDVTEVSARFAPAVGVSLDQVLLNSEVVTAAAGDYRFPLAAGPNVVEVHTSDDAGRAQTYRWVVLSDLPAKAPGSGVECANPDPDPEPTTDPTTDPEPTTDPDPTTDPTTDPEPTTDPDPTTDPTTDPEPTTDPDPTTDPTTDPEPTTDPTTDPEPTTDPDPSADSDPTTDPEPTTDPTTRPSAGAGSEAPGELPQTGTSPFVRDLVLGGAAVLLAGGIVLGLRRRLAG
ncbi:DUF1349 domain-containing protein [Pseudactinotalea sp. HY160]|uniref:DUF1349 domain-containing protein n=1 Tax=Pseudactinotalea sp. HY160 TaxID=2654490 RepID=UPI00128B7AE8|nr:DUF1349 domain-containing protein [Pseudactinotalea sp. HY160]MPV48790.1 DUF1349 domain-containing protein [Pseudactinotalea sp. HY160]